MLSFFRRIINSKAGVVVTFIVLGVITITCTLLYARFKKVKWL